MNAPRITRPFPCIGCGTIVRRKSSFAVCRPCADLRWQFLKRELAGVGPNDWIRGQNAVCGSKRITRAVVMYERGAA